MAQASTRSYDDLPEADVATVLEVPLLWESSSAPTASGALSTPRGGAHASGRRARATGGAGRHRAVASAEPRPARSRTLPWRRHPLAHTVEVGLISATLVLGVIGATLLALAFWLP